MSVTVVFKICPQTPERLPDEIETATNAKGQLLSAGKCPIMICLCSSASTHMIRHFLELRSFPFQHLWAGLIL